MFLSLRHFNKQIAANQQKKGPKRSRLVAIRIKQLQDNHSS